MYLASYEDFETKKESFGPHLAVSEFQMMDVLHPLNKKENEIWFFYQYYSEGPDVFKGAYSSVSLIEKDYYFEYTPELNDDDFDSCGIIDITNPNTNKITYYIEKGQIHF